MKKCVFFFYFLLFTFSLAQAQTTSKISTPDPTQKIRIVETACGSCQLGLSGKSCALAVKMNNKAYYVEGTSIKEHGDEHAEDGFCSAVSKAEVQGKVVDGKFVASYFKLVKE